MDAKDILGLICFLKEKRNCKIALIVNEKMLCSSDMDSFRQHCEKTIDIDVELKPTPEDIIKYVINPSDAFYEDIVAGCCDLNIYNVRIMQRIFRYIEQALPMLNEYDEIIAKDAVRSLILYVWAYYNRQDNTPSLDFIKSYNYHAFNLFKKKDDLSENEKRWNDLLGTYRYWGTDEVDEYLLKYITSGYLDEAGLRISLDKKQNEIQARAGVREYEEVWGGFYRNFDSNEIEFTGCVIDSYIKHVANLNISHVQTLASLLRKLGRDNDAKDMIDLYFSSHYVNISLESRAHLVSNITDEYIISIINERITGNTMGYSIKNVMEQLVFKNDRSKDNIDALQGYSADELYAFFKEEKTDLLNLSIRKCLEFDQYQNEELWLIRDRIVEALKLLAKESRFNKLRVSMLYGINIEDNE